MKHTTLALALAIFVLGGMTSPARANIMFLSFTSTGTGYVINTNDLGNGAVAGDQSSAFNGVATVGALIDIDRFDDAYASRSLNWTARYLVSNMVYTVALSASNSVNVRAFTNFSASSNASASSSLYLAGFPANPFVQSDAARSCDSGSFSDCQHFGSDSDRNYIVFPYSAIPYLVEISGSSYAYAYGDTFNGSAEASGEASTSWRLSPIPEPGALSLFCAGILAILALGRRRLAARGVV